MLLFSGAVPGKAGKAAALPQARLNYLLSLITKVHPNSNKSITYETSVLSLAMLVIASVNIYLLIYQFGLTITNDVTSKSKESKFSNV